MDPNSPSTNNQPPATNLRPMNEPHIPISEAEMNPNPGHASRSGKGTLLTLASLLVLAGVVGITLWLYIQNRVQSVNKDLSSNTNNLTEDKEVAPAEASKVNLKLTSEQKLEKYGVICKRFTSIEDASKEAEVACSLDLSGQQLKELPTEIYNLENLSEIDLSNNDLTIFPSKLLEMPNLISIDLSKNSISSLTSNLVIPNTIQNLKLTENNLQPSDLEKYERKPGAPSTSQILQQ